MAGENNRGKELAAVVILTVIALTCITVFVTQNGTVIGTDLGLEDNGRTIAVGAGETVKITVVENPSTGYTWQYHVDESRLQILEDVYTPYNVPSGTVGAGGTRTLLLKVVASGEFVMDYVRPWDNQSIIHFSVFFIVESTQ